MNCLRVRSSAIDLPPLQQPQPSILPQPLGARVVVAVAIEGHKAVKAPGITRIEGWHFFAWFILWISELLLILRWIRAQQALDLHSGGLHLKSSCFISNPAPIICARVYETSFPSLMIVTNSSFVHQFARPRSPRDRAIKSISDLTRKTT